MEIISSSIDTSSSDFQQNSQHHKNLTNELKERLARVVGRLQNPVCQDGDKTTDIASGLPQNGIMSKPLKYRSATSVALPALSC